MYGKYMYIMCTMVELHPALLDYMRMFTMDFPKFDMLHGPKSFPKRKIR